MVAFLLGAVVNGGVRLISGEEVQPQTEYKVATLGGPGLYMYCLEVSMEGLWKR